MKHPLIELTFDQGQLLDEAKVTKIAENAISAAVSIGALKLHPQAELSILIAGDETLKQLNFQWRGKNMPTNVLSFAASEVSIGEESGPLLGDIAISWETMSREAELENKSLEAHFTHLIVHGLLHLLGYDHDTDVQAAQMEGLETQILKYLGYADPYHLDV